PGSGIARRVRPTARSPRCCGASEVAQWSDDMSFYELQGPTVWADPPSTWSSTLLDDVEACPRRWQLLRSGWGDFDRFPVRPHPAAIEGEIIHEALDRLTRACGQRGNPPLDSPEFRDALADADFFPGFAQAV